MIPKKQPVLQLLIAIVFIAVAMTVGTIVNQPGLKRYFPYFPAILLLLTTWWLYRREGKSMKTIGLTISGRNFKLLLVGFLIGAVAFLIARILRTIYSGEALVFATSINYNSILSSMYYLLPMVLVEELLFRGYLFKKTLEIWNITTANILFSVLFTLIHIMDEQVLSRPPILIMLLVSIPIGHLLFATALLRSGSLLLPVGLHLGNNWATRHLVSSVDDGNSILFIPESATFDTWPSFIGLILIYNCVFALVLFFMLKWKGYSAR
ncbi:MAG: CPBP family intramembrane glutamic endopeptidase [Bacteroidota bacterium]